MIRRIERIPRLAALRSPFIAEPIAETPSVVKISTIFMRVRFKI